MRDGVAPRGGRQCARREVAAATGLAGMSGYLGATLFSLAAGALVAVVGYDPLFVALAAFDVLGAIVVWRRLPDGQRRLHAPPGAAPGHASAAAGG
ncbi:hypothetical protein WS68_13195 [Burkholderia sp. TSV86]|nr:hypothetical protein WS68_13195 [Burkholderia sp. TSV86]